MTILLCLSQFQLGTSPPGKPWGFAQKNARGSGFEFLKLPGGREFDKDRDFVESSNYA